MPRAKSTKPCLDAHCERDGNDSYGLCNTHARAWKRANADKRCDNAGCTNYLHRPGRTQPVGRSLLLDGVMYRRCNEHFPELLFHSPHVEDWNIERFAELIRPDGNDCWVFATPFKRNSRYGEFSPYGADIKHEGTEWLAHKVAYGLFVGGYGKDHQIDHRCKNGLCVRPDHLQAVTEKVNRQRRSKKPMRPYAPNRTEFAVRFAKDYGLPF